MEEQKKLEAKGVFRRLFRGKSKNRKASDVSQPSEGSFPSSRTSLNVDSQGRASALSSSTSINVLGLKQHRGSPASPLENASNGNDAFAGTKNSAVQWSKIQEVHSDAGMHRGSGKEAAVVATSDKSASDNQPYDLWSAAYDHLKETKYKLVVAYEKILTSQPRDDGDAEIMEDSPNAFENLTGQQRAEEMKEIVDKALEKAKRHAKLKENITKAVDFVKKAEDIVGSTLQSYPPAALAWSGICVLLPALIRPITQNKAMYDGLDHVVERMEWYIALSRLLLRESWKNDKDFSSLRGLLAQRIQDLYEALIEYEMKSVCRQFHTHPVVNAIGDIISLNDWDSKLNSVIELEKKVNRDFNNYNTQSIVEELHQISTYSQHLGTIAQLTRDILEQAQQRQKAEEEQNRRISESERSKLVSAFSASPYNSRIKANPPRVEGTCEWFRKHAKFRRWLDSKESGLLLVSADPGCGKSVLARYLIEDELLNERKDAAICYFFFKDNIEQCGAEGFRAYLLTYLSYPQQTKAQLEKLSATTESGTSSASRNTPGLSTPAHTRISAALEKIANSKTSSASSSSESTSTTPIPITSLALSYVMHKAPYVFPVIGGRNIAHLRANVEALRLRLSGEEMDEIEDAVEFDIGFPLSLLAGGGGAATGKAGRSVRGPGDVVLNKNFGNFDWVEGVKPILPHD